jgi:glucans biosynthesis protein
MDVEAALFPRKDIAVLGVAPITSMFWYSESARRGAAIDWRPEIHDSDGLAIVSHSGESLWRPLNNPTRVRTSSFPDTNPGGFGLLQRDRDFDNYEDDGDAYEKRPSVWIEPRGDWGEGAVQLVEIPTEDEVHDNIVAYWLPKQPIRAGSEHRFAYRLSWAADPPRVPTVGRVIATRIGLGGSPGQPRPANQRKFVVDFAGGPLDALTRADTVVPVVAVSRGRVVKTTCLPVVGTKSWRVFADVEIEGDDPIGLRLYLARNGTALTETWLYEFLPEADVVGAAIRSRTPATAE